MFKFVEVICRSLTTNIIHTFYWLKERSGDILNFICFIQTFKLDEMREQKYLLNKFLLPQNCGDLEEKEDELFKF